MANPFKEAEKAKKTAPGSKQNVVEKKEEPKEKKIPVVKEETPVKKEEPAVVAPVEKKEEKPVEKAEPEKQEKEKEIKDIFAGLNTEKAKPTLKTYAFYISDDNANKLKQMAEKKGISTSKLLDYILSEVL